MVFVLCVLVLQYSSRHILESLQQAGQSIKVVHMCGGLSKNTLYVQAHADVIGNPRALYNEVTNQFDLARVFFCVV